MSLIGSRARRAASGAVAVAVLGAGVAALTAGAARAGTLVVNVARVGANSDCSIFAPQGTPFPELKFGEDCTSDTGMTLYSQSDLLNGHTSVPYASRIAWETDAPPGIVINTARVPVGELSVNNVNGGSDWSGGTYWGSTGAGLNGGQTSTYSGDTTANMNSSDWGFQLVCSTAPECTSQSGIGVSGVQLTATENQGPTITPIGPGNLFSTAAGTWVWNPPGDAWPIPFSASDPSGACNVFAEANTIDVQGPTATPVASQWQQCPNPTWSSATLDTTSYVPSAGTLPLTLEAVNAAHVSSSVSNTVDVDNDPVGVSFTTPTDPNPTVWVNHAVTVVANPTAGPSGIGAINCSVDGSAASVDPSDSLTVDGDGMHTVSCTASNNAVDPQGNPNTGTGTEPIAIDEAPPAVSFEAENPSDPTQLVADTSDTESGVTGGQISITAPGSSTPVVLPTAFDGSHLIAGFGDAGLHGAYTFTATSCDAVGNCASTSETLNLPLRLASTSDISFRAIRTPAQIVSKLVRVGFRFKREHRHGKLVRVRVGGHLKRIRIVIPADQACTIRRIRIARHRWREIKVCRVLKITTSTIRRVGFGRNVKVHGLAITAQGAPLAGVPITIKSAPVERGALFHVVTTVTTGADGTWSATLPAGPSRIIHADYLGSATVLPAVGRAKLTVPAHISLSITPRRIPWSGAIRIRGQLDGGYIPADGVALRLLARYPGTASATPLLALRTDRRGRFSFTWSYHSGRGVATYPFSIATTATESDYPFAAATSKAIPITFGR